MLIKIIYLYTIIPYRIYILYSEESGMEWSIRGELMLISFHSQLIVYTLRVEYQEMWYLID